MEFKKTNLYKVNNNLASKIIYFVIPNAYDLFNIFMAFAMRSDGKISTSAIVSISILIYILTHIGVGISKWLLNIVKPESYLTFGFWDSVRKKFFWNFGPQTITAAIIAFAVWVIFSK